MSLSRITEAYYQALYERRKKLTGRLILVAVVTITVSSIPDIMLGIEESYYSTGAGIICFIIAWLLNRLLKGDVGGHFAVFSTSLIIFFQASILGFESYVVAFYFPLIMGVPFIIDRRKALAYWVHLVHPIAFFIALMLTNFSLFKVQGYPYEELKYIGYVNLLASALLTYFFVWLFIKDTYSAESRFLVTESKLTDQNNKLEKTNQELDRFVYSVSHDLRAPIINSVGLVDILTNEYKETSAPHYLELLKTSIIRLDEQITDILDFSKNNRMEIHPESVLIKEEIERTFVAY